MGRKAGRRSVHLPHRAWIRLSTIFSGRRSKRVYVWLERVTAKITTKLVVVSYANAEKGEKNGVFQRGDWILCRDAISVDEFMQTRPAAAEARGVGHSHRQAGGRHDRLLQAAEVSGRFR